MKSAVTVWFACAGVQLLTACAGIRPPVPPAAAITTPDTWRGPTTPGSDIGPQWWSTFGDPVLARTVAAALAHNDDIQLAATRVEQARAAYELTQAQRLPLLVGELEGDRQRDINPGFGFPERQTVGAALLSASYDADLFGRLAKASAAARAKLLASQDAQDSVRLAVAAAAAAGYINLRALDAKLAVLRDTLITRENALQLARRRATAGYTASLDLHQAEAEYEAARQSIPAAELAIRRQENGLSVLTGETPHEPERGLELNALAPPAVPTGLPANLLRRRPDIAQAEQQLVAADHTLDAARAAFLPDIQLTAQAGGVTSSLIEPNPTSIYTLGGSLLGPLFDGGRLHAQQHGAAAQRDQAAFEYRKAALYAFKEVEDALTAVQKTHAQETALMGERDALAMSLKEATRRYQAGYSPYLEQLEAQRSLLSAELALVQSHADRLNAATALYQALGGGWHDPRPAASPPLPESTSR